MRDETYWSIADEFEVEVKDGQMAVPAERVAELAVEIWKHNRNCKSHSRREESEADMDLFRFKGISSRKALEKAGKIYEALESGVSYKNLSKYLKTRG